MLVHRAARPGDDAPYGDPHFHLHFTLTNEQGVARRRDQLIAQRKAVESEADALRVKARKQMEDGQARLTRENTLAGDQAQRSPTF
jgi:hypothetical protein